MSVQGSYLPNVSSPYLSLKDTLESRSALQEQHEKQIDLALHILSSTNYRQFVENRKTEIKQQMTCYSPCESSDTCNMVTYLFNNSCRILPQSVCCFKIDFWKKEGLRPVSESAYQALEAAKKKFENNTCALGFAMCVIPPAIYLAGGTDVGMIASALLNAIGTVTTGCNTFTFTGAVTATEDQGRMILRGVGPEVLAEMQKEYAVIADRLLERALVKQGLRAEMESLCSGIKNQWSSIEYALADCGLHTEDVKKVLSPLAKALYQIDDRWQNELKSRLHLEMSPLLKFGSPLEVEKHF